MNNGIVLLRCLLMYLIVLHHTICHTKLSTDGWLFGLFLLTVPAVDGFISISGWFGIKFSWRKVGVIFGQIAYYAVLGSTLSLMAARLGWVERPVVAIGNAWYGVAYLALMFVCPIVNAGLETLQATGRLKHSLFLVALLLICDWLSRWLGLGFTVCGFGSHTFATFLLVYVLSWGFRRTYNCGRLMAAMAFVLYASYFMCVRMHNPGVSCVDVIARAGWYNCPLVVMTAIGIVSWFSTLTIPEPLTRVLRVVAPSMFAIYLIHDASPTGKLFLISRPGGGGHLSAWTAIPWSICVFMLGVGIDLVVRRLPLWMAKRILEGRAK